jgi:hypothetical protein
VLHGADWLVTPPSSVMALLAGYAPTFHPTINTTSDRQYDDRPL